MPIDPDLPEFPYQQVATQIRRRILAGELGPQLPSCRQLAGELGVARNTVQRALNVLKDEGVIYGQQGRGTFVRQ